MHSRVHGLRRGNWPVTPTLAPTLTPTLALTITLTLTLTLTQTLTLTLTLALAQTLTLALALTTRARRGHQSRGASRLAVGENPKVPHGDERYLLPCSAQLNRHSVLTTYH